MDTKLSMSPQYSSAGLTAFWAALERVARMWKECGGCALLGTDETLNCILSSLEKKRHGPTVGCPVKGHKDGLVAWSMC